MKNKRKTNKPKHPNTANHVGKGGEVGCRYRCAMCANSQPLSSFLHLFLTGFQLRNPSQPFGFKSHLQIIPRFVCNIYIMLQKCSRSRTSTCTLEAVVNTAVSLTAVFSNVSWKSSPAPITRRKQDAQCNGSLPSVSLFFSGGGGREYGYTQARARPIENLNLTNLRKNNQSLYRGMVDDFFFFCSVTSRYPAFRDRNDDC